MKDGSVISEIARRLKISENSIRNTLKTFKMTGGIQHHADLYFVKWPIQD